MSDLYAINVCRASGLLFLNLPLFTRWGCGYRGCMATRDDKSVVQKAIERRDAVRAEMKALMTELEEIQTFLRVNARFSTEAEEALAKFEPAPPISKPEESRPTLTNQAGHGEMQRLFELLAKEVILKAGYPLQTTEIAEHFHRNDTPIGGTNEWKTVSNRMWQAKAKGLFSHMVGIGYWPADTPYSPTENARPQNMKSRRKSQRHSGSHRPIRSAKGRPRMVSDEQLKQIEKYHLEGKSAQEISVLLGGINRASVYNYLRQIRQRLALEAAQERAHKSPDSLN